MTSSRKQIIAKLALIEKKMKSQQVRTIAHREYLLNIIHDNRVVFLATLLPGFIWGWRQARVKGAVAQMGKKLIQYGLLTALAGLKKQLLIKKMKIVVYTVSTINVAMINVNHICL